MDERLLYYIWLSNTFSPGSPTPKILLSRFNSITDIYNATRQDYASLGISQSDIIRLHNKDLTHSKAILNFCLNHRIGILCFDDPVYPERLKIIDNPPPMLYYTGRTTNLDDYPCITMVGTRSCSERGFRLAYKTAYDAASKGAVIVNGLALGIDGACIAGALDANGYAVGVLGCGIDRIYPAGNKDLFERLSATGLILTEFAPFTKPEGRNFPVRNRVISALSVATCIFEANASKSGAMITAEHAINQGRSIFAVPAKPYDKNYSGALGLIKNGANLLTEANDILSEYSLSFPHRINLANKNTPSEDKLNELVSRFFNKDVDPDQPVNRRFLKSSTAQHDIQNTSAKCPQTKQVDSVQRSKSKFLKASDSLDEQQKIERNDIFKAITSTKDDENDSQDLRLSMLTETDRGIYDVIKQYGPISPDELTSHGFRIEQVLASLTILEIYTDITAVPGGRYTVEKT